MARTPRSSLPRAGYFHVICRSNNRQIIFRDNEDYSNFIGRVYRFRHEWPFTIHHYSVMPTHIHFEVEIDNMKYFSKAIQAIELSYYGYFSEKYNYSGHLWHGRFRSIPIETEEYLFACGRYIELNALTAGIVNLPEEYRWSSCRHYLLGKEDRLIEPAPWYLALGTAAQERQTAYNAFLNGDVSPASADLIYVCGEKDGGEL